MSTHSFSEESYSSIWKEYKPPSRASVYCVPAVDEHSDWAAAGAGMERETRQTAHAIANVWSNDLLFTKISFFD
jgi:hypothetical protein